MSDRTKKVLAGFFILVILAAILTLCSAPANADDTDGGFTVAPVVHQTVEVEPWETKCSPTLYEELNVLQQRDEYHVDYIYELENKIDELQEDANYATLELSRKDRLINRLRNKLRNR